MLKDCDIGGEYQLKARSNVLGHRHVIVNILPNVSFDKVDLLSPQSGDGIVNDRCFKQQRIFQQDLADAACVARTLKRRTGKVMDRCRCPSEKIRRQPHLRYES